MSVQRDPTGSIRRATRDDAPAMSAIFIENVRWLKACNMQLWSEEMFTIPKVEQDIDLYEYYVADRDGGVIATFRLQFADPDNWPDVSPNESIFLHRLAVRRAFAGDGIAQEMLLHAKQRTQGSHRRFLRLDCAAERPKLRAIYENAGFVWRDDRTVGPHLLSRYEWHRQE